LRTRCPPPTGLALFRYITPRFLLHLGYFVGLPAHIVAHTSSTLHLPVVPALGYTCLPHVTRLPHPTRFLRIHTRYTVVWFVDVYAVTHYLFPVRLRLVCRYTLRLYSWTLLLDIRDHLLDIAPTHYYVLALLPDVALRCPLPDLPPPHVYPFQFWFVYILGLLPTLLHYPFTPFGLLGHTHTFGLLPGYIAVYVGCYPSRCSRLFPPHTPHTHFPPHSHTHTPPHVWTGCTCSVGCQLRMRWFWLLRSVRLPLVWFLPVVGWTPFPRCCVWLPCAGHSGLLVRVVDLVHILPYA